MVFLNYQKVNQKIKSFFQIKYYYNLILDDNYKYVICLDKPLINLIEIYFL